MTIDCICDLFKDAPYSVPLDDFQQNTIKKLKPGEPFNFAGTDYIFVKISKGKAEWISLA